MILWRIIRGFTGRIGSGPATRGEDPFHAIDSPNVSFQDEFNRHLPPRLMRGRVGILHNCRDARVAFALGNKRRFDQFHRRFRADVPVKCADRHPPSISHREKIVGTGCLAFRQESKIPVRHRLGQLVLVDLERRSLLCRRLRRARRNVILRRAFSRRSIACREKPDQSGDDYQQDCASNQKRARLRRRSDRGRCDWSRGDWSGRNPTAKV